MLPMLPHPRRSGVSHTLASPSFAVLGTTFANDMSPDGMTWDAVVGAFVVDAFGKYIQYIQRYNANTRLCYFVVSNDDGATWADNGGIGGGEGFLVRGSSVYDAGRDCFHGLIVTTNAGDGGIIYRRYSITRDGSNNITSIARVAGVSVSLDSDGTAYEFPTILMSDADTLIAAWTVRTGSGGEIRACKCDISGDDDAGGTASNWVHLGLSSTTTIGGAPHVGSYTVIYSQASAVFTYFSLIEMASGDLGWLYHSGAVPGQWRWRRSVRSAANTWDSLSNPVAISNMQVAGTDTGYSLKVQLASKLVEDGNGNMYVAAPVWLSDVAGDTVRLFKVTSADEVSVLTIYSAGAAHSYAPTCGLAYDAVSGRLVVAYIKTTTSAAYVQLISTALAVAQAEALAYDANPVDIPLVVFARNNGRCGMAFRRQGSPPQPGYFGTMVWG